MDQQLDFFMAVPLHCISVNENEESKEMKVY